MTWKNANLGELTEQFFTAKRRHRSGTPQESGGSDDDDKDYFASDLYRNLEVRRSRIREVIGQSTACIYAQFFFYPSSSLGNENVRELSQASH
jgi:hypothetical protein